MGHNDDAVSDFRQAFLLFSGQVSQYPLSHIFHIIDPFFDVSIIYLLKELSYLLDRFLERPLGVHLFLCNGVNGGLGKHAIIHDHQLRIKYKGMLLKLVWHPILERDNLLFRGV